MKLGSLKGGRDGRLVVVSRDLAWCADATHIAPTLQAALDDWETIAPQLENLATDLAHEAIPMMRFHERHAEAPLPRAFQWVDGPAHLSHVEPVGESEAGTMSDGSRNVPLMYRGASDRFLAPRGAIPCPDQSYDCDFEAKIVVVTGDVPQGARRDEALGAIRLVGLANDITFRSLASDELAKGIGFVQSKPGTALSPVLVTADELGDAWRDGKLAGVIAVDLNGRPFSRADAGTGMSFDFGTLVAHLASTRDIGAGSVIGSGTISRRDPEGDPNRPAESGGLGYSCIAEQRAAESILGGGDPAPFLRDGDTVRIQMNDDQGHAIFGTIEQTVAGVTADGASAQG